MILELNESFYHFFSLYRMILTKKIEYKENEGSRRAEWFCGNFE